MVLILYHAVLYLKYADEHNRYTFFLTGNKEKYISRYSVYSIREIYGEMGTLSYINSSVNPQSVLWESGFVTDEYGLLSGRFMRREQHSQSPRDHTRHIFK